MKNILSFKRIGAPSLSFLSLIFLLKMSNFMKIQSDKTNIFVKIGDICIILAFLLYLSIWVRNFFVESKYKLTRDRWHTVFPTQVFLIVFLVFLSYPMMCIGVWNDFGVVGVSITTISYMFINQVFDLFL